MSADAHKEDDLHTVPISTLPHLLFHLTLTKGLTV